MFPTIRAGDYLFIWRWGTIKKGDLVVADHRRYGRIVKRVSHIQQNTFILVGDNVTESTSSENIGSFTKEQLVGKVIWHINGR